ncbi:hypothetical protein BDV12DRAFT_179733 [Aspergillus spectabilis]
MTPLAKHSCGLSCSTALEVVGSEHGGPANRYVRQNPIPGVRIRDPRRQAIETVSGMTYSELCAIELLRDNNCMAAPRIRTHEVTTQDDTMLVPCGFLHYILMDNASGVQLSKEIFWGYPRDERDRIREAYKEAWSEWIRCGVSGGGRHISHLFWDSDAGKITIAASSFSSPVEPFRSVKWRDSRWLAADLLRAGSTHSCAWKDWMRDTWIW